MQIGSPAGAAPANAAASSSKKTGPKKGKSSSKKGGAKGKKSSAKGKVSKGKAPKGKGKSKGNKSKTSKSKSSKGKKAAKQPPIAVKPWERSRTAEQQENIAEAAAFLAKQRKKLPAGKGWMPGSKPAGEKKKPRGEDPLMARLRSMGDGRPAIPPPRTHTHTRLQQTRHRGLWVRCQVSRVAAWARLMMRRPTGRRNRRRARRCRKVEKAKVKSREASCREGVAGEWRVCGCGWPGCGWGGGSVCVCVLWRT